MMPQHVKDDIVYRILNLETIEPRGRDYLDFPEVSVMSIGRALDAAYEAGRKAALDEPLIIDY